MKHKTWFPELLLSFAACQNLIHLFQELLRKVVRDSFQFFICPNYLFLPIRVNETSLHCLSQALCSLITLLFITWNMLHAVDVGSFLLIPTSFQTRFFFSFTIKLHKSESVWLSQFFIWNLPSVVWIKVSGLISELSLFIIQANQNSALHPSSYFENGC